MKVKEEYQNGSQERRILSGLITNKSVLGRVVSKWDGKLFASRWANIVAGWCVEYYNKHGEAPGRNVASLFESWAEANPDDATVRIVDRFLTELSDEHARQDEEFNVDYLLDLAGRHFNTNRLTRLASAIEADLKVGKAGKAESRVTTYNRVELGVGAGIDVFNDENAMLAAFERSEKPLIEYDGGLKRFFGSTLGRDQFVAFMAPEKFGKSFWLLDIAWNAMRQRKRVAFFETGDMSQDDIMRRIGVRAAEHPDESPTHDWPCTIKYPIKIEKPSSNNDTAKVEFEEREFDRPLDGRTAHKGCKRVMQDIKSNREWFRLSCHPNFSIDVPGIRSVLDSWIQTEWIPDVVVIDYADILALPKGKDRRDQINETWMQLRRLSQELHVLLVTATQANRESYDKDTIHRSHVSEDKRKLAHVTALIGINTTSREKKDQVYRLNMIAKRRGAYSPRRCVYCASCLALSMPAVLSVY